MGRQEGKSELFAMEEAIKADIETAKQALEASRNRLLNIIENVLINGDEIENISDVEIVDGWTVCARVDGVDVAITVTPA